MGVLDSLPISAQQRDAVLKHKDQLLRDLPSEAPLWGAFAGGICLGLLIPKLRQPFRRYKTVDDIPMKLFNQEATIRAVNVHCTDGDTFRVRHLPLWRGPGSYDGKRSDHTLQIRLAAIDTLLLYCPYHRHAIDTPETAKFGNAGQPYGDEARTFLEGMLQNRKLKLTLLHKDQYSRAVCMVHYGIFPFRRNVSEEMLKSGLAHVYRQAGAVYGGQQEKFDKLEAQARKKKVGIWKQGKKMETSAEYKARTRK